MVLERDGLTLLALLREFPDEEHVLLRRGSLSVAEAMVDQDTIAAEQPHLRRSCSACDNEHVTHTRFYNYIDLLIW